MTLRELLTQTAFDNLVPYIKRSKQPDDMCHYKQAYDATHRLAYLEELISKYDALKKGERMQKCVVRLSISQDFPLTQEERGVIYNKVKESTMDNNPILIEAIDNALGSELGVMIVGIEK